MFANLSIQKIIHSKTKKGEVFVKLPGTINGNQFIIKNLEDCFVYIFDNSAVISVDDCKNCRIFIGPSKGSVFIRNSNDCNIAVICQQFRTRDCQRITTFISCATMPIVEASSSMRFACLSCNYRNLESQLTSSKISVFNSNWSSVHDFSRIPGQANWTLLNRSQKLEDYVPYPEDSIKDQLGLSFQVKGSYIPFTIGTTAKETNESCLVVIFHTGEGIRVSTDLVARKLINEAADAHDDLYLVDTKHFSLSELSAERVFESKNYNKFLTKGPIIGLEFNGRSSIEKCKNLIQKLKIENYYMSDNPDSVQQKLDNFNTFAEMRMSV